MNYSMAINTPNHPGDGQASLVDLSDWTERWFLGTHFQLSPATSMGLVYRSKWTPILEGQLAFSNLRIIIKDGKVYKNTL